MATVKVDGIIYSLDYGLRVDRNLDLVIRDGWQDDEEKPDLTEEEIRVLRGQVADLVDLAFTSGTVGNPISEDDFDISPGRPGDGIPAFIKKRMEAETEEAASKSLK